MFRGHNSTDSDNGSSVVGFVLVAPLLVLLFVAIGQIAMLVADKSVMDSAAAIGARSAATADGTNLTGRKAILEVMGSRGDGFQPDAISITREKATGIEYVVVTITKRVEISFVNKSILLTAKSRAQDEGSI